MVKFYRFGEKRITKLLFIAKDVPPLGYKVFKLNRSIDAKQPLIMQGTTIENEFFKVEADPKNGGLLKITR